MAAKPKLAGYFLFMQEKKSSVPGWSHMSNSELQRMCDPLWKALSKEEKERYKRMKKDINMKTKEQRPAPICLFPAHTVVPVFLGCVELQGRGNCLSSSFFLVSCFVGEFEGTLRKNAILSFKFKLKTYLMKMKFIAPFCQESCGLLL